MNPLYAQFLTGLIRALLAGIGGALVARGWFTQEEIGQYITEFSIGTGLFITGLIWSFVNKYWSRWKLLLALEAPSSAKEATIDSQFERGVKPSTPITQKAGDPRL